jgi:hypothetical protein
MLHQYSINDVNREPQLLKFWLTEKSGKNEKTCKNGGNSNSNSNGNGNSNGKKK